MRDRLRAEIPWLADEVFDLRSKGIFKDQLARAICCALPTFDLVIVDEGHNLKHGFEKGVAARNRVLALALGHTSERPHARLFPGYGPRASRVLFLSATPVEDSYTQLWRQLDVLGHGEEFKELADPHVGDEIKKKRAAEFLIRRVTVQVGGQSTRISIAGGGRRRGGARRLSLAMPAPRGGARSEEVVSCSATILQGSQIGMLASESFRTTRVKRVEEAAT
jgi:hypothetical protein